MSFWIHPEAAQELTEATLYYAENANTEVAKAFLAEFEQVKNLLIWNQKLGKECDQGFRILYFHHFPYGVVYSENPLGPEIYAICHQRREPKYWKSRY